MPARNGLYTPWRWFRAGEALPTPQRPVFYDSEFVREKSYYPRLALIQWQYSDDDHALLCDPLDVTPPWSVWQTTAAPLVLHSGEQDLELMRQDSGALPRSIRDTQIGFALCYPNLKVSFAEMVAHYLGESPDKSATRSDWLQRPLDNNQLDYAANDVGLLRRIYPLLCAQLSALGRLQWWAEECAHLLATQHTLAQSWHKLRNVSQLKGRETAVAALLHQVREQIAQEKDWPRRKVLDDAVIIKIARHNIETADELAEYLDSDHLLFTRQAALDEGFAAMRKPWPVLPRSPRLNARQRDDYDRLFDRRKEMAAKLNIHPDMLATQRQLRFFVADKAGEHGCRIGHGWRAQFFADLLK